MYKTSFFVEMKAPAVLLLFLLASACQSPPSAPEPISRKAVPAPSVLLFTGSSSIRLWKSLPVDFPDYLTINTGFGGSQFSDLIAARDTAIFRYQPEVLFVYEGDNDLALGKSVATVVNDARLLMAEVRQRLPQTQLVLISPKPSPARWKLQQEYQALNEQLRDLCSADPMVHFIDMWPLMLKDNGRVNGHLFVSDSLHMNAEGYARWREEVMRWLEEWNSPR